LGQWLSWAALGHNIGLRHGGTDLVYGGGAVGGGTSTPSKTADPDLKDMTRHEWTELVDSHR
jgi:hypothetical protein